MRYGDPVNKPRRKHMALAYLAARRKDARTGKADLQHRHFATIATIIADQRRGALPRSKADIDSWAYTFANELASTNPRFDRARFLSACGVEE
jgi:hypothetical protein